MYKTKIIDSDGNWWTLCYKDEKYKNCSYLGHGSSSIVLRREDEVIKITSDNAVIDWNTWCYLNNNVVGVPKIKEVDSIYLIKSEYDHLDLQFWINSSVFIGKMYQEIDNSFWSKISKTLYSRNEFRRKDGLKLSSKKLINKKLQVAQAKLNNSKNKKLTAALKSLTAFTQWMNQSKCRMTLDIDLRDNWMLDSKKNLILNDPVFDAKILEREEI